MTAGAVAAWTATDWTDAGVVAVERVDVDGAVDGFDTGADCVERVDVDVTTGAVDTGAWAEDVGGAVASFSPLFTDRTGGAETGAGAVRWRAVGSSVVDVVVVERVDFRCAAVRTLDTVRH